MGPEFGSQYGNEFGIQLGPMSIPKLSPNWATQMGPILFLNFCCLGTFNLTSPNSMERNGSNYHTDFSTLVIEKP